MKKFLLIIVIMLFTTSFSFCKNRDSNNIIIIISDDNNYYHKMDRIIGKYNKKNYDKKHISDIGIIKIEEDYYILHDDNFHNYILNQIDTQKVYIGSLYDFLNKQSLNKYNEKLNGRYIKVDENGEIKEKLKFIEGKQSIKITGDNQSKYNISYIAFQITIFIGITGLKKGEPFLNPSRTA